MLDEWHGNEGFYIGDETWAFGQVVRPDRILG
ncbi:hypothetical protein BH10ACI3_BH10ACI3_26520 [soil metagenome]